MALNIKVTSRKFIVIDDNNNEVELPDPNPTMTLEDIRKFYSGKYPEIINSTINGPKIFEDTATYSFNRAVGTKG